MRHGQSELPHTAVSLSWWSWAHLWGEGGSSPVSPRRMPTGVTITVSSGGRLRCEDTCPLGSDWAHSFSHKSQKNLLTTFHYYRWQLSSPTLFQVGATRWTSLTSFLSHVAHLLLLPFNQLADHLQDCHLLSLGAQPRTLMVSPCWQADGVLLTPGRL